MEQPIVKEEEKISSAYASAESSPNTSLKASLSFSNNKQQQPMSTSRSSHELLEEYLLNGNTNSLAEFQSLPPNLQSDENKTNVEQLIMKTINDLVPKRVTSISGTAVSSSSPNPESNPFKLLTPNVPTSTTVASADNQDNRSTQIIENLALLSHNEHEKADPILTSSSKSPINNASSEINKIDKCIMHLSPSKSTSSMNVPASSQEFCMDLNLNIAASAAVVNANGTSIAITSSSSTNSLSDHNRFTSNASTSSIHNDLKMIVEESKENKTIDSTSPQSTNDTKRDEKSNKSSLNTSIDQSNENSNGQSTMTNSIKSSDLINQMMLMINKKTSFNNLQAIRTQQMNTSQEQQSIDEQQKQEKMNDVNDQIKHNRYDRDFLNQVRKQKAELIETIYPEIFKVYSYCMTGKHWDPEKYFDIVQYSGDYDKIEEQHQQQNSARNKNRYQSKTQQQQQQQQSTKKKSYNNNRNQNNNNKLYNNQIDPSIDSPQLQVPKNSPKSKLDEQNHQQSSSSNEKNQIDIMSLLMNKTKNEQVDKNTEADRLLLNMLKVNKQQKNDADLNNNNEKNNIMDILTNKQNNVQPTQTGINIINNLFKPQQQTSAITNNKPATNNAHYPLILTAQELEMLQLKSEESRKNVQNNSDAYKQLVMNLNNHPLNSSSSKERDNNVLNKLQNKPTQILDNVLSMLTNQSNKTVNNNNNSECTEGTAILKQLLNLDANNTSLNDSNDKKSKSTYNNKKNHHHNHNNNHRQNKHKSQSSQNPENEKFPSINPTDKPFQNYHHKLSQISEVDHFNSLLNKIMPTVSDSKIGIQQSSIEKDSIMKWFSEVNSNVNLIQKC